MGSRQMIAAMLTLVQLTIVVCNGRHASQTVGEELDLTVNRFPHQESDGEFDPNSKELQVKHIDGSDSNGDDDGETSFEDYTNYRRKRQDGVQGGLTRAQKNKVLEVHNKLRRGEGSSNMLKLTYSERLAQLAQNWADRCDWGHRPQQSLDTRAYGFDSVGENIWAWSGGDAKTIPEKPIQDWFDEKSDFFYDANFCARQPCGHYTAVVWADTKEVGCGLRRCPVLKNSQMTNAHYFVCNYGPAGNMVGVKPFKKGTPCSECSSGQFFCTEGMCDHTCRQVGSGGKCECKSRCENGSPTPDCKCRCNSGYSGVRCNERCGDKNPKCGANPGWPVSFCHDRTIFGGIMYDRVNQECPRMCGKCQ